MATLTVEVQTRKTFWFYVVKAGLLLRQKWVATACKNKPLASIKVGKLGWENIAKVKEVLTNDSSGNTGQSSAGN